MPDDKRDAPAGPSDPDDGSMLGRSLRLMQENIQRSGPTAMAGYTLISALLVCGGLGYALDYWLGTSPWFLTGGLLLGIVVGFFQLARIMFRP